MPVCFAAFKKHIGFFALEGRCQVGESRVHAGEGNLSASRSISQSGAAV